MHWKGSNSFYLQSSAEHFYLFGTETGAHLFHMNQLVWAVITAGLKLRTVWLSFHFWGRYQEKGQHDRDVACCFQDPWVTFYQTASRQSSLRCLFFLYFSSLWSYLYHRIFCWHLQFWLFFFYSLQAVVKHTYTPHLPSPHFVWMQRCCLGGWLVSFCK